MLSIISFRMRRLKVSGQNCENCVKITLYYRNNVDKRTSLNFPSDATLVFSGEKTFSTRWQKLLYIAIDDEKTKQHERQFVRLDRYTVKEGKNNFMKNNQLANMAKVSFVKLFRWIFMCHCGWNSQANEQSSQRGNMFYAYTIQLENIARNNFYYFFSSHCRCSSSPRFSGQIVTNKFIICSLSLLYIYVPWSQLFSQ